jgi:hypothetical protein
LVALLAGAERVGISPLALEPLHTIAYFTDVLAPVWGLPVVDGQILKRYRPYYPALQRDLDRLVGQGVVVASGVQHALDGSGDQFDANYSLNHDFAGAILLAAESFPEQRIELAFIREVVYATSGLGLVGLENASEVDATYADPLIEIGGMIEVSPDLRRNSTARVAVRFGELLGNDSPISTAEMINLYVRQLYARMQVA